MKSRNVRKVVPFNEQESKIRNLMQDLILQHLKEGRYVVDEEGDNVTAMVAARSAIVAGVLTMTAPLYDPEGGQDHKDAMVKHVIEMAMEFVSDALKILSDGAIDLETKSMVVSPLDSATRLSDAIAKFKIDTTEH